MIVERLFAGLSDVARGLCAVLLLSFGANAFAATSFPFDQELLLDAAPMPPVKRVPVLAVGSDGIARIDLWCKTVQARIEIGDGTIRIAPASLPDALPRYMSSGQCTDERIQADITTLAALAQVTTWSRQNGLIVLSGPTTLRFRPSSH